MASDNFVDLKHRGENVSTEWSNFEQLAHLCCPPSPQQPTRMWLPPLRFSTFLSALRSSPIRRHGCRVLPSCHLFILLLCASPPPHLHSTLWWDVVVDEIDHEPVVGAPVLRQRVAPRAQQDVHRGVDASRCCQVQGGASVVVRRVGVALGAVHQRAKVRQVPAGSGTAQLHSDLLHAASEGQVEVLESFVPRICGRMCIDMY